MKTLVITIVCVLLSIATIDAQTLIPKLGLSFSTASFSDQLNDGYSNKGKIGIIGGVAGIILALIIAWLQINYKLVPLEGGSFLIDYYPVKLKWPDFVLVAATVLFIALLASWIPARKAARQEFSLRSE